MVTARNSIAIALPFRLFSAIRFSVSNVVAICLAVGICLGTLLPLRPDVFFWMATTWLTVTVLLIHQGCVRQTAICAMLLVMTLGVCRMQSERQTTGDETLRQFSAKTDDFVRVTGTIRSVPAVHTIPADLFSLTRDARPQTRFVASIDRVITQDTQHALTGECRVYVTDDCGRKLCAGDQVVMTGQLNWPAPPGNPGEFDFPAYLRRQGISAQLFVVSANAITVIQPSSVMNPQRWISQLHHDARQSIVAGVHPAVQSIALAVLLGNRNQLPSEVEQSFIASGTMHLLAISGLHVGILFAFLQRIAGLLLVGRRTSLVLTAVACIGYAFVTDLRPSVVRATVFIVVYVISELSGRNVRISSLLSTTVIILLTMRPWLLYDTGAWLSFLSVAALGWISWNRPAASVGGDVPLESTSLGARLKELSADFCSWLALRLRQILSILAVTTPLIATTFHVISPVGIVVNILLIPLVFVSLWAGFVTLFVGTMVPALAVVPGTLFSWLLGLLLGAVEVSAAQDIGHLYLPNTPAWFLPTYYLLLLVFLLAKHRRVQRATAVVLMLCVAAAVFLSGRRIPVDGVRVTVLDIGHGSSAVVEVDDRVFLVDAGSLGRSERPTQLICHFLWERRIQRLDGIIVSHADMDHYNAVPGIMKRLPVTELMTSPEFARSNAISAQAVVQLAGDRSVPARLLHSGDVSRIGDVTIRILQADPHRLPADASDNERSLVVVIEFADRRIILPGDIEGVGLELLLNELGDCDVLVSPHHGSINSNTPALAETVRPAVVIASSRDTESRAELENVFSDSDAILFSSEAGAVTTTVSSDGNMSVSTFRQQDLRPNSMTVPRERSESPIYR